MKPRAFMRSFVPALLMTGLSLTPAAPAVASGSPQLLDRVAARVNSDIITENQVLMRAFGRLGRDGMSLPGAVPNIASALDDMVEETLLAQAAGEEIKEIPEEKIANRVEAEVRKRIETIGSREAFDKALKSRGWDIESYKRYLREQEERVYKIQSALAARVRITPQDIEAYEQELKRNGKSTVEYWLRHILLVVPANASAAELKKREEQVLLLLDQILKGVPFETLARERSEDKATKDLGGDLGWMGERDLQRPIREAVEGVQPGHTTQPVRTARGIHIFEVVRKRGPAEMLFEKRMAEAHDKWVVELRRKSDIKIFLERPLR